MRLRTKLKYQQISRLNMEISFDDEDVFVYTKMGFKDGFEVERIGGAGWEWNRPITPMDRGIFEERLKYSTRIAIAAKRGIIKCIADAPIMDGKSYWDAQHKAKAIRLTNLIERQKSLMDEIDTLTKELTK